uniref:NADH dehydrogenase [ubiquinone] 1 beta subcomplex subunit 2, mitochondrial n=1 Tax=Sphenodon punctatus TaxID=8508 RepID=A0A8D0GDN5_SPHPU
MVGSLCRVGGGLRTAAGLLRAGAVRGAAAGLRHGSGWVAYRQFPEVTRLQVVKSESLSGLMWFWILWSFWHNSEAVLGHFPYPDSSEWTDEELGIPPDEYDE